MIVLSGRNQAEYPCLFRSCSTPALFIGKPPVACKPKDRDRQGDKQECPDDLQHRDARG
jgi:hypothetical protein